MKKILGLLAMLIITGCDDGDMTFQTFNFANVMASSCQNGVVYKINGSEALVLNLDPANFANVETTTPRIVTVSTTTNTVQYFRYANNISGNAICNPSLAQPPVETWIANGGTLTIETNENSDEEDPSIITGYTHTIKIVSLSFTRNDETIIIQDNEFGDYITTLPYRFNFNGNGLAIQRCTVTNTDRLYITSQNEVLRMDLDQALFASAVTEPGEPRTQVLDGNQLRLDIYANNSQVEVHTCNPDMAPPIPARTGIWRAVTGTVEVTTTSPVAGQYIHEIKLVNVTFENLQTPAEQFTRNNYILPPYTVTE